MRSQQDSAILQVGPSPATPLLPLELLLLAPVHSGLLFEFPTKQRYVQRGRNDIF